MAYCPEILWVSFFVHIVACYFQMVFLWWYKGSIRQGNFYIACRIRIGLGLNQLQLWRKYDLYATFKIPGGTNSGQLSIYKFQIELFMVGLFYLYKIQIDVVKVRWSLCEGLAHLIPNVFRGLIIREYLFSFFRITIDNGKLIPTWKNHALLRLSSKIFNLTPLPPGKPCVIIEVNKMV